MAELESILARLVFRQVTFVIIGGYAAVAHGCTLLTMDVDICCDLECGNLMKIQAAVGDLHPVHRMTAQRLPLKLTTETCAGLRNLYLDTDLGQLDCIGHVKGIGDFQQVLELSEEIELPSGRCKVLTLDGIIQAKEALDRPRDHEAVLQLKAIRERRSR